LRRQIRDQERRKKRGGYASRASITGHRFPSLGFVASITRRDMVTSRPPSARDIVSAAN
jgi:hypothetical protein